MRLGNIGLLVVSAFLFSTVTPGQILEPLSAVPEGQRDSLKKRLDGYVDAYKKWDWKKFYGFLSTIGRGGIDEQTFLRVMNANHSDGFEQYPAIKKFLAYRTRMNADGYDIIGCGEASREGESYGGIIEFHAVFEHNEWSFTGWVFRDTSEDSCKQLANPNWQPDKPILWNRPMEEIAKRH